MIVLLLVVAGALIFFLGIGYFLSAPVYKGPPSDHFNGKTFINPGAAKAKGLGEVLKWMSTRQPGPWKEDQSIPAGEKPVSKIEQGWRVTFVNHSSFLLQFQGINLLTDPVWSERTSPFSFAGPKRMRPPGIKWEELPHIDVVLLSHNHYDHLDIVTIKKLNEQFKPRFVVPLGVRSYLHNNGITDCIELDWWGDLQLNSSLHVKAVPAQHFSGRGMFDRDATLWCGYVLNHEFYFAGDTGYNATTFKEIGERCKPKYAIIPIGAFKPEWFMSPIHCSPAEAVQIHIDLKVEKSIATHFGTFPLADDGQQQPVVELKKALENRAVPSTDFVVPKEGVPIDLV